MFPSLLWLNEDHPQANRVIEQVFDDVNLDRLLPASTIKKMQDLCTPEEIAARQAVFRKMSEADGAAVYEALDTALASYSRVQDAMRLAKTEYETLLLFAEGTKKYRDVLFALRALPTDVPFSDRLLAFACSAESNRFLAELDERIPKIDSCLKSVTTLHADMILDNITLRDSDSNQEEERSVCDTIRDLAAPLAICIETNGKQKSLFPDDVLAAGILELHPEACLALREFRRIMRPQMQNDVLLLRDELQFYLSVRELVKKGENAEIPVCFPAVSKDRIYRAVRAHDISLTLKGEIRIVPNDIDFSETDRVCFLTGANGGGKTTFIRTVTINLLLFLTGCPIFADRAEIYPFRQVFTHFTTDERFEGSGRLVDEQKRVEEILATAERDAFLLLNETFSGTDDQKGLAMTLDYSAKFKELGCFSLFVTHFHEVNDKGYTVFNTVIDVSNDNRRTFRIVKSDSLRSSYAEDILRKYALTQDDLTRRLEAR